MAAETTLSLLSDCVARFALEADKAQSVDCLVRARSLYVMKDVARYKVFCIKGIELSTFHGIILYKRLRETYLVARGGQEASFT